MDVAVVVVVLNIDGYNNVEMLDVYCRWRHQTVIVHQ